MLSKHCWMSMTVCWAFAFTVMSCAQGGNPLAASTNRKCCAIYAGFKEMAQCVPMNNLLGLPFASSEAMWWLAWKPTCLKWWRKCCLQSFKILGVKWNMLVFCYSLLNNMLVKGIEGWNCPWLFLSKMAKPKKWLGLWKVTVEAALAACVPIAFPTWQKKMVWVLAVISLAHAQLVQHSSEDMFASWDRMEVRYNTCNVAERKRWQQATGITYSPESLMVCPELRYLLDPVTLWVHDYMHCLLSNGLLAHAIFYLLEALSCWQSFFDYTQFWKMPKNSVESIFAKSSTRRGLEGLG